jgi:hypothetical protein
MYFNKILRVWVFDPIDYFFISAIFASLMASHLKEYLSERAARERLKRSIIAESNFRVSKTPLLKSKESKILRIYRFAAFKYRGGQLDWKQEFS